MFRRRLSYLLIVAFTILPIACILVSAERIADAPLPIVTFEGNSQEQTSITPAPSITDAVETAQPSGSLKPADSETPAAGICAEGQGDPVSIDLGLGLDGMPLAGRCVKITPEQRIKLVNRSTEPIKLVFGEYHNDLPAGSEALLEKPAGQYLALGVHLLPMGPELWVQAVEGSDAPMATMPGPLRNYENPEVGYSLTIPPGWNVDENGLTMPNKEVIFSPGNAEPFVSYLSISLDPRTMDQILNAYAESSPDAMREDVIFNGLPAYKYTYTFGRHEYYIPYQDRVFLIITDRPMDGNIQQMLLSITFL